MIAEFFKYFAGYIFKSKTRQRLLFIAIFGLLLSSFSLVVIQGVMGGLQNGLVNRSKNISGTYEIVIKYFDRKTVSKLLSSIKEKGIEAYPVYELELLIKNNNFVAPVILHGLDTSYGIPQFLKDKDLGGVVLGADLGNKVKAFFASQVNLISPSHTDPFLGDVPRQLTDEVTDFVSSELFEIDSVSAWVRMSFVKNLVKKNAFNKIRFYDDQLATIQGLLEANPNKEIFDIVTWEDKNSSLVWALNLETGVMLFLFISMSFLVAICITSGFMIFFDKIKIDLISYWVLGLSKKSIQNLIFIFTHVLSIGVCLIGISAGLGALYFLDTSGLEIFPDIFVERRIPVKITAFNTVVAFLIPYSISAVFSAISFRLFKKENTSFVQSVREVS